MTFYDNEAATPDLPRYQDILNDCPSFQQSLKFWSQKAGEISPVLSTLASNVERYHESGSKHQTSGLNLSDSLSDLVKVFNDDSKISEPIAKFSDVLQRIECYRDMLLNQTHLLMWEPLVKLSQEYEKAKELNAEMLKARDAMHLAWEKFSSCPHIENLQEPGLLDKLAHSLFHSRQQYQKVLLKYVNTVKEIHTLKKVVVLQKILEHMLAQFSFFNFGYQTLKDVEPYMNELFQELQDKHTTIENSLEKEAETQQILEQEVFFQQQKDAQAFGEPQSPVGAAAMNIQAGKFLNKIGDLFQSSSFGLTGTRKSVRGSSSASSADQEWEVIDRSSSKERLDDNRPEKPSSSPNTPEKKPSRSSDKTASKKDMTAVKGDEASPVVKEENQEKVFDVVPQDLISFTADIHETLSENLLPAPISSLKSMSKPAPPVFTGCKSGYLRIRQKAFPKNRWPLLYFIVDKENGSLLAQGQEQGEPSSLENLLLCTVKICDVADADRNFCFQLISTTSERVFQALTNQELQSWVSALQEATADALRNSKAKLQSLARSTLASHTGPAIREVKSLVLNAAERIRKVDGNKYCADCSAPRPDWASINLGITVCIECSGVHRNMGVHVSKVRSLSLDKWEDTTVEFMEAMGNTKSNLIYEGKLGDYVKSTRDSSKDERQKFIKLKYVEQRFYKPPPAPELDPEVARLMANRPGESEQDLFDLSGEIYDEDERDLMGSSPLCLVQGCEECKLSSCRRQSHGFGPQLVVSDSGEDEEDKPESQC